jgi:hypothetical protein
VPFFCLKGRIGRSFKAVYRFEKKNLSAGNPKFPTLAADLKRRESAETAFIIP